MKPKTIRNITLLILLVVAALTVPEVAASGLPFVMMALARDRKRINVKGGGKWYFRELSPAATDTYSEPGYSVSTEVMDEHTMVGDPDEAGNEVDQKSGAQKVTATIVLKQSSKDEIDFVRTAKGKYFEGYYPVQLANGQWQELSFPLCKINPGQTLSFKSATERTIEVKVTALAPKAAYTRAVTAFNVVENEPYILVEGGSKTFNLSNTEAAALATAIL